MSRPVTPRDHTEDAPNQTHDAGKIASLDGREIVDAKSGSNKGWYILALVVGGVVMVGTVGFGTVGLLQSHGLISLPHSFEWLKTAIAAFDTPHSWSLWVMAGGGALVGVTVIGISSSKIHKIRMAEAKEAERQTKLGMFGNNFDTLEISPDKFSALPNGSFTQRYFQYEDEKGKPLTITEYHFIILKKHDGQLLCTVKFDLTTSVQLGDFLISEAYNRVELKDYRVDLEDVRWENFGDNFAASDIDPADYSYLQNGTFVSRVFGSNVDGKFVPDATRSDRNCIFLKTSTGQLLCTKPIDDTTTNELEIFLKKEKFLSGDDS